MKARNVVRVGVAAAVVGSWLTAPVARGASVTLIPPTDYAGWNRAYRLTNAALEAVVVPAVGRIVHLSLPGQANLLRLDPALRGLVLTPTNTTTWFGLGGDWLWPVAQSRWKEFAPEDWPPPEAMAERAWTERAWQTADGTSFCLMTRQYAEPLHLKVRRLIRLDATGATLTVQQRIERVAPSPVPVCLWTVSQIAGPQIVFVPTDLTSAFPTGFKAMLFGEPDSREVTPCKGVTFYDATAGNERKLGSDSRRRWIAAQKDDVLIIERTEDNPSGTYPDGGCTVEMYANAGLGYCEIETLSPEQSLQPGEKVQNALLIQCCLLPRNLAPCEASARVSKLMGE